MLTVGELAVTRPSSVKVLQRLGIDFCCGGALPLAEACLNQGVDPRAVLDEVEREEARASGVDDRWDLAPLPELIAHIVSTHHRPLDAELPRLTALVEEVTTADRPRDPEGMDALRDLWSRLVSDLLPHLREEEAHVFPWILGDRATDPPKAIYGMGSEHVHVSRALTELREVTDEYTLPDDASDARKALWAGLEALEADLQRHIHLENNVLFPRAVQTAP
ncbi:MAG: DUF542 domain-containing protein [Myxococcota bacterium]